MSNLPIEHQKDAQKLEADGYVELFEITLRPSGMLYLKQNNDVTWQGRNWEGTAIKMSGVTQSADEKASRPRLQVVNPAGIFSPLVYQGKLNRATVSRYRVLREHLLADLNIYRRQTWMVTRPASLTGQYIVLELRETTDGPNFTVPARYYAPPDFPVVNLR